MATPEGLPYERLVGRYALYGEIASGGMATVHIGRLLGPVGFSRTVAIKRLHAQFAKDPEFVAMFLDEARLAGRIQHPNVVSTLDVVALEGELFLVMEYVQGESLARLLGMAHKARTIVPPSVAVAIMAGVLYGLHAAHEATDERGDPLSIVHRDVSPQNVLVGTDGVARVLDFGVAKAAGRMQATREGEIKGKLAYMAPEQMRGEAMDRRTDIYGAAVVLWETLTARRLFDGEHAGVIFSKVMSGRVAPPSSLVPGVPEALDAIVARGLAHDLSVRYSTAREMAMELEDRVGGASPRQVSEWLASVAGDSLSKRAVRVKQIESLSTPPPSPMPVDPMAYAAAFTPPSGPASQSAPPQSAPPLSAPPPPSSQVSGVTAPPMATPTAIPMEAPRRGGRGVLIGAAVGCVAALAVVAVFFARGGASSGSNADAGAVTGAGAGAVTVKGTVTDTGTVAGAGTVSVTGTGTVAGADTDTVASTAPAASAAPVATASASARPATTAGARLPGGASVKPKEGASAPPKGDCLVPYVIENGIKRIKPQCL